MTDETDPLRLMSSSAVLASEIIDRIDEAIHLLDVELHPALALTTMGRLIAEIADGWEMESTKMDRLGLVADLHAALDLIDSVIRAYGREDEE
jgi:hypothetical protein